MGLNPQAVLFWVYLYRRRLTVKPSTHYASAFLVYTLISWLELEYHDDSCQTASGCMCKHKHDTTHHKHTRLQYTFDCALIYITIKLTFRKKKYQQNQDERAWYWVQGFKDNFWQNFWWVGIKLQEHERVKTHQLLFSISKKLFSSSVCVCVCAWVARSFMLTTMSAANSSTGHS